MQALLAMSKNRAIGFKGGLPWKNSGDLKFFKNFTNDKVILFGRQTYKALPILPDRTILCLTKSNKVSDSYYNYKTNTAFSYINFEDAVEFSKKRELIICGGAETYSLFMAHIDRIFVSMIPG